MVQLQDSISKHQHHLALSNMFSNKTFEAHHAQILSCSNLGVDVWFIIWVISPTFRLSSLVFCTTFYTQLRLFYPSITNIPQCVCTHPIDPIGIHLSHGVHGNKHTKTHDVIRDTFATIAQNVGFHVGREQLHVLLSTTFNSFCWQFNIVLTRDDICTLVDIVIPNPTWANLFPWSCAIPGFATFDAIQTKEKSYRNRHPIHQFLPLAIEVFGYYTNIPMCFYMGCQCHLELEGDIRLSSFNLGHFFS
jgi:hypothetical protein